MLVYFAWLANKNKSRLKSSDIKFCLIAIVECLVLLVCSVTLCFWTANMPQCLFQVCQCTCQCTHELTVCVLCCFWTIKKKKKKKNYVHLSRRNIYHFNDDRMPQCEIKNPTTQRLLAECINGPGSEFMTSAGCYLWLSKVSANERKGYIYTVRYTI